LVVNAAVFSGTFGSPQDRACDDNGKMNTTNRTKLGQGKHLVDYIAVYFLAFLATIPVDRQTNASPNRMVPL
jgi:hypothetical protein